MTTRPLTRCIELRSFERCRMRANEFTDSRILAPEMEPTSSAQVRACMDSGNFMHKRINRSAHVVSDVRGSNFDLFCTSIY